MAEIRLKAVDTLQVRCEEESLDQDWEDFKGDSESVLSAWGHKDA